MQIPGWKCDLGNGEFDHDWEFISDWYGDPNVINGTAECSYLRCKQCGEESHDADLIDDYRNIDYSDDYI